MHSRYVTISKEKVRKEKRKRMGGDEWEMARKDSLVKSFAITGSKEMGQWLEAGVDRDTGKLLEMEDNMACCYAVVRI